MSLYPFTTMSSSLAFLLVLSVSTTVGILLPHNVRVVSAFGSQPITKQLKSSFP